MKAALSIEISSVRDDYADNFFLKHGDGFPEIKRDEVRRCVLYSMYRAMA